MESRRHIQWLRKVLARFYHLRGATHRHFGNTSTDLAEHQRAVNDFSRAIELDPDYAEAYFSRGVLRLAQPIVARAAQRRPRHPRHDARAGACASADGSAL